MSEEFRLTSQVPVGGRASHDHYPTPRAAIVAIRGRILAHRPGRVFDPACGEGAILDVFREAGVVTLGYEIDGVRAEEARRRGHGAHCLDALAESWPDAQVTVMNPPFSLADAFVRRALAWRRDKGPPVYALLRLSFLEPVASRADLLRTHTPDVLVLPQRPRYDGRGTDAITSAWFVWPGKGQLTWPS